VKRDLLRVADLRRAECEQLFVLAADIKGALKSGKARPLLAGKTLAMIFEKPSLRTRISFETGMFQLGGHAIYLAPWDIRLGERETVADIARNLARVVDMIVARTFLHSVLVELAEHATVPVINGLTDLHHPCQVLADLFTLVERRRPLDELRIAFIGDGNNMVHSWMEAATIFRFTFALACPAGYEPDGALMHGRGLGEDAPMLWGARRDFPEKEAKLKEGHVFILKPACKEGFMRDSIRAGDTVAIEANGARRLGKRDLTFVAV